MDVREVNIQIRNIELSISHKLSTETQKKYKVNLAKVCIEFIATNDSV